MVWIKFVGIRYIIQMNFERFQYPPTLHKKLYRALLFPRLIEEKMLILLRQGKISKWFSGIGQEAIAVGATMALRDDEYILPLHRNLGVFTVRDIPPWRLFAQFMGKEEGFTRGRDRSFHFGTNEYHIVGMISHLAAQLSVADGIALASKLKKERKTTLVFTGEGGTSEGEFHEALNVAAVWKLPVIFLVENNGYALSTPVEEQFAFSSFADKGTGYGMKSVSIDGNNILEVYDTMKNASQIIRKNPEPILIEAKTFRIRGHEEASGIKYVPDELIKRWEQRDPIKNYEQYLLDSEILEQKFIVKTKEQLSQYISEQWKMAEDLPVLTNSKTELTDVYVSCIPNTSSPESRNAKELRFIDAISNALDESLDRHERLILMGQDIAEYGGAFKVTEGLVEKYGKERIRNTPLCESAVVGIGLGLSVKGFKSVIEMQFADFVSCGFNQIVNNLAKSHYRWGQHADVVIRMPTGAGLGAGPFHSQSTEAWFFHVPGLKIVYPSSPKSAKGLLLAAIEDPNPVLFFEHKLLYRSAKGDVPDGFYLEEIGKAEVVQEGKGLTIVSYGLGVVWIRDLLSEYGSGNIELIDLKSLLPWDKDAVADSVKKTSRLLIVHEDTLTGGVGAEISAYIGEHCFQYLDAPIKRVASLDTPVPFNKSLEMDFLPKDRIKNAIDELLAF